MNFEDFINKLSGMCCGRSFTTEEAKIIKRIINPCLIEAGVRGV